MSWLEPAQMVAFLAAMLALNFAPGPNLLFAFASSLAGGSRSGALAALGVGIGLLIHLAIATLLTATMVRIAPTALNVVRVVGAAYLIWLGLRTLRSQAPTLQKVAARPQARTVLLRGMLTSLTNPKPVLFFVAFLPQFTSPSRGSVAAQMLTLGLIFIASATVVNTSVGWSGGVLEAWLARRPGALRWPVVIGGWTMLVLGAGLLFEALMYHVSA